MTKKNQKTLEEILEETLDKTLNGKYLNIYLIFAGCLCALCILGMVLIGIVAFEKNTWSYGLIILLFLSLVMAILAVISLVAYYREKGRYHERIIPLDIAELSDRIQKVEEENDNLNAQNKSLSDEISKLRELFGTDWEDGCKETKDGIVKDFCKKVDERLKAVKSVSEAELAKIKTEFSNIINPTPAP
jgi:hypothetical protein